MISKPQFILLGGGIVLLASLFFFGTTAVKKEPTAMPAFAKASPGFNLEEYKKEREKKMSLQQVDYLNKIENSVSRGDIKDQQIKAYDALSAFWRDSIQDAAVANYYTGKAAELVNSEKSLTFAAQLILEELRGELEATKRSWEAQQAIALFNKALEKDPDNDDLKIGLGSCYVFGKGMAGDGQETMKGIMQLLSVVQKDSNNMKAQLMLGIGGVISTQYDKAIPRLLKVIQNDPKNLEAVSWLAEAYAGTGDKQSAIKWYKTAEGMMNNPQFTREAEERIKALQ